jgi:Bacterial SH3 domain
MMALPEAPAAPLPRGQGQRPGQAGSAAFARLRAIAGSSALALCLAGAPAAARAAPDIAERLQVAEPFLELHTGPGRGYPVFFVVEKTQWVVVELRRTDWYRVRAEGGQVGWVPRRQLESTLTAAGGSKTFRDLLVDDYLARRVEFSGGWGRFKGEPMLRLGLHARLADTVGAEIAVGQVQGLFSGSDFWHLSLSSEPWSDRRLSPYFAVGLGKFRNIPNSSLVDAATTNANLAHASLGLRWYISERFTARLDWTLYTAFVGDTRSVEYRSLTAGLGFFF